jgi:hypothetical protein
MHPSIMKIVPSTAIQTDIVTITGAGFGMTPRENILTIGGLPSKILRTSAFRMVVIVPAQSKPGKFPIVLTVGHASSAPVQFEVKKMDVLELKKTSVRRSIGSITTKLNAILTEAQSELLIWEQALEKYGPKLADIEQQGKPEETGEFLDECMENLEWLEGCLDDFFVINQNSEGPSDFLGMKLHGIRDVLGLFE